MPHMQLSKDVHISLIEAATADGTTAIQSATVDMQGFQDVLIFTTIASFAVDNIMSASQGDESDGSDMAVLAGSSCIALANADVIAISISDPEKRYVEVNLARGTTTVVGEIWCIKSKARIMPTSWADVITTLQSPAEGSA